MILVDSRAGSNEYAAEVSKLVNCKVKLDILDSADVAWEGCGPEESNVLIGVEIKTLGDMITSMRSGRYIEQLDRMRENYAYVYLLIQGTYGPQDGFIARPVRGGWEPISLDRAEQRERRGRRQYYVYSELDKFLASIEIKRDVIVRKASTKLDAANQIADLYNWWQKGFDQHHSIESVKTQNNVLIGKASVLRRVASQLPGIGWDKAGKVDKTFKTVEYMANALPSEWAEIEGIGKKLSVSVYGAIRGN